MPKGTGTEYWACIIISIYINYITVSPLSWVAWQCCLLFTVHVYELYLWLPSLYKYFTVYVKYTFLKLCTWTGCISMQYLRSTLDDGGVSTLHICMVPHKIYRSGGLQWRVYMDFHKHWFIDVCHVSVLCTYTAVCLQPDLRLEMMLSVWCDNLRGLLHWIRGVICLIILVIYAFFLFLWMPVCFIINLFCYYLL